MEQINDRSVLRRCVPSFQSRHLQLCLGFARPKHQHPWVHFLGPKLHTNNYAEYQGLIRLLKFLYKARLRNVVIYCDSLLVVNQVNDVWDVNSPDLLPYWQLAYGLLTQGCHVLKHIKGHDGIAGNEEADRLCNEELDRQEENNGTVLNPKANQER